MTNINKNCAKNNQILVKSTLFLPEITIFLLEIPNSCQKPNSSKNWATPSN